MCAEALLVVKKPSWVLTPPPPPLQPTHRKMPLLSPPIPPTPHPRHPSSPLPAGLDCIQELLECGGRRSVGAERAAAIQKQKETELACRREAEVKAISIFTGHTRFLHGKRIPSQIHHPRGPLPCGRWEKSYGVVASKSEPYVWGGGSELMWPSPFILMKHKEI